MSCSNCYNGCTEIVSDKCVKYTGLDVAVLGIKNGDSLSYVEQAIIEFLTSTLDGTGIILNINPQIICNTVNKYIEECSELTLVNVVNALIKAACDLQEQVDGLVATVAEINGEFDVDCLEGVTSTSTNHDVLQVVITKLCGVDTALAALALNVDTNYVKLADLDDLIADYLANQSSSTKLYTKMVPYTVVEYYGAITGNFDATGAGLGDWEKIYLCNGNNGTPDKRGRVAVGAIQDVGGGSLAAAVDPAFSGNPNYALGTTYGANVVTLTSLQIPAHTHGTTVTLNDPGHFHFTMNNDEVVNGAPAPTSTNYVARTLSGVGDLSYFASASATNATVGKSSNASTGISVSVANNPTGGGQSHNNVQPVLACYYIMYIPS